MSHGVDAAGHRCGHPRPTSCRVSARLLTPVRGATAVAARLGTRSHDLVKSNPCPRERCVVLRMWVPTPGSILVVATDVLPEPTLGRRDDGRRRSSVGVVGPLARASGQGSRTQVEPPGVSAVGAGERYAARKDGAAQWRAPSPDSVPRSGATAGSTRNRTREVVPWG